MFRYSLSLWIKTQMMKSFLSTIFLTICLLPGERIYAQHSAAANGRKPTLIVNIIVGGLEYDAYDRYKGTLSEGGFKTLVNGGVVFTDGRYDFMQTNTPATLATITTGCNPSVHGVVGEYWQDYVNGERVGLIDDPAAQGLNSDIGIGCYSYTNLTAPTLGDQLKYANPQSKVITIAADPVSAISMGGFAGHVYWLDTNACNWTSSSKYMLYLPGWVARYNERNNSRKQTFAEYKWKPVRQAKNYVNSRYCLFDFGSQPNMHKIPVLSDPEAKKTAYGHLLFTPAANDLVVELAKFAVVYEELGKDENPDILNIYFDAPRNVIKLYGPESVEAEDMFYRVDRSIASLLEYINSQANADKVLYVLTADHGVSRSCDISAGTATKFNGNQFRTLVSSFLGAQFGGNGWVNGYYDHRLYLNRTAVYNAGLSLRDVQERVAGFSMQFRGISHAITGNALQDAGISDPFTRRILNGYYPKRSGDLALCFMPGWIEDKPGVRADSGSPYDYDTHVPLIVFGCGLPSHAIKTPTDMTSLAPTLARILQINRPAASTGHHVEELTGMF